MAFISNLLFSCVCFYFLSLNAIYQSLQISPEKKMTLEMLQVISSFMISLVDRDTWRYLNDNGHGHGPRLHHLRKNKAASRISLLSRVAIEELFWTDLNLNEI